MSLRAIRIKVSKCQPKSGKESGKERGASDSDFITAIEADSTTQDMLYKPHNFASKINFVLSGSFR